MVFWSFLGRDGDGKGDLDLVLDLWRFGAMVGTWLYELEFWGWECLVEI